MIFSVITPKEMADIYWANKKALAINEVEKHAQHVSDRSKLYWSEVLSLLQYKERNLN